MDHGFLTGRYVVRGLRVARATSPGCFTAGAASLPATASSGLRPTGRTSGLPFIVSQSLIRSLGGDWRFALRAALVFYAFAFGTGDPEPGQHHGG
jgi:hypothetical protein